MFYMLSEELLVANTMMKLTKTKNNEKTNKILKTFSISFLSGEKNLKKKNNNNYQFLICILFNDFHRPNETLRL